jgi:hypothetical protein
MEQSQQEDHKEPAIEVKRQSNRSPPYALFNLLVIVCAIVYAAYYHLNSNDPASLKKEVEVTAANEFKLSMFTADELKTYNGEGECQKSKNKPYLYLS